jgi:hypothetical protein
MIMSLKRRVLIISIRKCLYYLLQLKDFHLFLEENGVIVNYLEFNFFVNDYLQFQSDYFITFQFYLIACFIIMECLVLLKWKNCSSLVSYLLNYYCKGSSDLHFWKKVSNFHYF